LNNKILNQIDLLKLTLEDFNQEYLNFLTLYPTAQGISLRHMSTFLNLKFNTVADIEPSFNNDGEIGI
jgi:hypothetical protein